MAKIGKYKHEITNFELYVHSEIISNSGLSDNWIALLPVEVQHEQ